MCKRIFGLDKAIINHQQMFLAVSLICFISFTIIFFMKERPVKHAKEGKISIFLTIRCLFKVPTLRSSLWWNFLGPTLVWGMQAAAGQYYQKAGIKREDLIILVSLITIPAQIVSSVVWIRIVKNAKLTFLLWSVVLAVGFVKLLDAVNCEYFKQHNDYDLTLTLICVIACLEVFGNWSMVQQSFFFASSPRKFTLTYISTISSLMVAFKMVPVASMMAVIDYVPMPLYFGGAVILQSLFSLATVWQVRRIDQVKPGLLGEQFIQLVELSTATDKKEFESPLTGLPWEGENASTLGPTSLKA